MFVFQTELLGILGSRHMTAWTLLWLSFRHNDPADSPPLVTPLDKCFVDKSNGQVTRVVVTALRVVRGPWSSPCRPSHPHPHSHPHQSPSPGRKGIENVDNWIHTWMITIMKPLLAPIGQLCSSARRTTCAAEFGSKFWDSVVVVWGCMVGMVD